MLCSVVYWWAVVFGSVCVTVLVCQCFCDTVWHCFSSSVCVAVFLWHCLYSNVCETVVVWVFVWRCFVWQCLCDGMCLSVFVWQRLYDSVCMMACVTVFVWWCVWWCLCETVSVWTGLCETVFVWDRSVWDSVCVRQVCVTECHLLQLSCPCCCSHVRGWLGLHPRVAARERLGGRPLQQALPGMCRHMTQIVKVQRGPLSSAYIL